MGEKLYLDAQTLLEDSFRLGAQIINSGFEPTFIVALWRGGVPMGIAVQEFLQYHGIQTDHIAIRTEYYSSSNLDDTSKEVAIYGISYLIKNISHEDRLLFIDDVFDTGKTIQAVISRVAKLARRNTPGDIRMAMPYYKPSRNQTDLKPDYYLYETEQWLKYPHSLEGLSDEEIAQHRPELAAILAEAKIPN
jgi:hypoxanthine phosphoribosyltransferase